MKIKFSILIIVITAVILTGVAVPVLRQASNISLSLSLQELEYAAKNHATYLHGREGVYFNVLQSLAGIMSDESVPAQERHDRLDDMLRSTLNSPNNFVRIYIIWKPNASDGMDVRFIGRPGSTYTGQYAMNWDKDTGKIVSTQNLNLKETTSYIACPNAHKDQADHPVLLKKLRL